MANVATLSVAINARGAVAGARQYQSAISQMKAATFGAEGAMGGLTSALTKLFAVIGGYMAFQKATDMIAGFEETMARLQGVTNATADDMALFRTEARKLGAETRFSASEGAEALMNLSRAGLSVKEAISASRASLDLAVSGQLELADASRTVSTFMKQFGLRANEASRIADVLTVSANKSNSSFEEFSAGLEYVGTVARQAGISIEETAAVVGTLSAAGLRGTKASMGLRSIIGDLINPSEQAQKVLKELGITLDSINPEKVGLVGAMEALAAANMSTAEAYKLFGDRAANTYFAIAANLGKIKELNQANKAAEGIARRNAALLDNTLRGAYLNLLSTIEELILRLGDSGFLRIVRQVVDGLTQYISILAGLNVKSSEVSDTILKMVVYTRKAYDAILALKGVIIALIAIQVTVWLVGITSALYGIAKGALLAAIAIGKMAIGIIGTLLPVLAALGAAIIAVEFGRWLESLEPVQTGMQHIIWNIVKGWLWVKKQLVDIWIVLSDFFTSYLINPIIKAFDWMVEKMMDMIYSLALKLKDAARALGFDDIANGLGKVMSATLDAKNIINTIEITPLGERMAGNEAEYQASLDAAVSAYERALDKIETAHEGKKPMGFLEFAQNDIYNLLQSFGMFKDVTGQTSDEVNKLRAELDGLNANAETIQWMNSLWQTAKQSVIDYGTAALQWLQGVADKQNEGKTKAKELEIAWDSVRGTIADGLTDLTMGAKGFNDALRDVTDTLIRMALQQAFISMMGGGATPAAAKGMVAMASGGVVNGPTQALIGERGPEAVVPLSRNERGELGIAGGGGGGSNVTFNIISPDKRGVEDSLLRNPKLIQQMNQIYKQGYAIG